MTTMPFVWKGQSRKMESRGCLRRWLLLGLLLALGALLVWRGPEMWWWASHERVYLDDPSLMAANAPLAREIGFPMGTVFLTLTDERDSTRYRMTCSDEGTFRFHCLADSTFALLVQLWDAPKGAAPLHITGIVPDRGPVELRASFNKPVKQKSGTVIGRIDDVAGRIRNLKAATVRLQSEQMGYHESQNEEPRQESG